MVSGFQLTLDPTGKESPKIGPDPSHIEKLQMMQPPTDRTSLRSFLGLVNQLGKFCSDYAMVTAKLRALLVKGATYHWTSAHQAEFQAVKDTLTSLEHLQPFCPAN